ncbi:hypothetical protein ACLML9_23670, partial [Nocardia sp. NPDC002869]
PGRVVRGGGGGGGWRTGPEAGETAPAGEARLLLPGSISIARTILESWVAAG